MRISEGRDVVPRLAIERSVRRWRSENPGAAQLARERGREILRAEAARRQRHQQRRMVGTIAKAAVAAGKAMSDLAVTSAATAHAAWLLVGMLERR